MRLFASGSASTPISALLDGLLVIVGFFVLVKALVVIVLLVNPANPLREYFQVTTLSRVSPGVWPADGLVRAEAQRAYASTEPMVFITFRPASREFVAAVSAVSFTWWACVIVVLLQLRGVLRNLSAAAPFPRENIRRVRLMGWAILAMAAADLLIDAGVLAFMRTMVTVAERPAEVPLGMMVSEFPIGTVLAGLAVVILSEIFRAGADLQDEQALTI